MLAWEKWEVTYIQVYYIFLFLRCDVYSVISNINEIMKKDTLLAHYVIRLRLISAVF